MRNNMFYFMFGCYIVLAMFLFAFLAKSPWITGNIVAWGGGFTVANIFVEKSTGDWYGFYGNVTSGSTNSTFTFDGGDITWIEISSQDKANTPIVYATTLLSVDWSNVSVATPQDVDSYLGVVPSDIVSGTSIFTDITTFSIYGTNYSAPSTKTLASNGTFDLGILKSNGTLIFVSHVITGKAFDGKDANFQFILPVPAGNNATYNFFSYINSSTNCANGSVDVRFNATIINSTNSSLRSVFLSWSSVGGASGYEIWYIDGLVNKELDFSNATKVSGITGNNWTDMNLSKDRFYKIAPVISGVACPSNATAAKLSIDLYAGWNLISFQLNYTSDLVADILRPIDGHFSSINEYDNMLQTYKYYNIFMGSVFSNFDRISLGNGYWLLVDSNITLDTAGMVIHDIDVQLADKWNLISFPVITHNDNVSSVLSSIDGYYSSVNEYDNLLHTYKYYNIFMGSVFSNFNSIKSKHSYWILLNESKDLNYTNIYR